MRGEQKGKVDARAMVLGVEFDGLDNGVDSLVVDAGVGRRWAGAGGLHLGAAAL